MVFRSALVVADLLVLNMCVVLELEEDGPFGKVRVIYLAVFHII